MKTYASRPAALKEQHAAAVERREASAYAANARGGGWERIGLVRSRCKTCNEMEVQPNKKASLSSKDTHVPETAV